MAAGKKVNLRRWTEGVVTMETPINTEDAILGCMLRIADALEVMNEHDENKYENLFLAATEENSELKRVIKRMERKIRKLEKQLADGKA